MALHRPKEWTIAHLLSVPSERLLDWLVVSQNQGQIHPFVKMPAISQQQRSRRLRTYRQPPWYRQREPFWLVRLGQVGSVHGAYLSDSRRPVDG